MKFTLAGALILSAGLAAAQNANTSRPPAELGASAGERAAARTDHDAKKAEIRALDAQEKTAVAAVRADAAKSKSEKDAAIKSLHADFKAKRDVLHDRIKADLKILRADGRGARRNAGGSPVRQAPKSGGR